MLINETIRLLQSFGGRASVLEIVDSVMRISNPEAELARMLVSDLVENDPRLRLNDEIVELVALQHDSQKLFETDFVVFDLETTGAKCPPCRVTEIGAYRIERGEIVAEFQTLVNPETSIPSFITQLTGISNSMVRDAPRFAEIASDFLNFIGDAVLVAHNAPFDMRFLNHEISRIHRDYRVANSHLCTVQLSRKLLPDIENHRLHTVAEHYSIYIENRHRAADDAHATAKIFVNLLHHLNDLGVNDLATAKRLRI
ncbi:MAG: 3'-5' exonuclease [Pyrinomonadaceae bacterium]